MYVNEMLMTSAHCRAGVSLICFFQVQVLLSFFICKTFPSVHFRFFVVVVCLFVCFVFVFVLFCFVLLYFVLLVFILSEQAIFHRN